MPTNAFYPSLNEFCTKYFVAGPEPISPADLAQGPGRDAALRASLFEHLLLFDTVTIKVHGENIPLALMFRMFGERALEDLLDQGAIRFVLWTPTIVHNVTEMPGLIGIMSGNLSSPAHSDPEQSIDLGLARLTGGLPRNLKRRLRRKVLPLYEIPPPDLAADTVALTSSAFASGKLRPLGFDPQTQRLDNLPIASRALLSKCAGTLLEYRYLLSRQMTASSSFEYFSLFSDSVQHISTSGKAVNEFQKLATLENMPDFIRLFPLTDNGLVRLPQIRRTRKSRKFREWLSTAVAGDKDITEEYLDAITETKGPLDTTKGKLFKAVALSSVGALAGHAAEGAIPGAMAGGLIAQAASPAVDFTLDLLDEFLLSGILKGWHPRMFFNDLRKLRQE